MGKVLIASFYKKNKKRLIEIPDLPYTMLKSHKMLGIIKIEKRRHVEAMIQSLTEEQKLAERVLEGKI